MCRVEDQKGDASLQDVHITRGDLDEFISILRRVEEFAAAARPLELDARMLRRKMEQVRHDLEPITRRVTPYPLETTVVNLPEDWPDKPGAKKGPSGGPPKPSSSV